MTLNNERNERIEVAFCNWWMSHHKRGPVESLWRRLTWL